MNSPVPIRVQGVPAAISISGGALYSAMVAADGTVWTWGYNRNGQLGDGTFSARNEPARIDGVSDAVSVVAAPFAAFAIRSDATVLGWGSNIAGLLTQDESVAFVPDSARPKVLPALQGMVEIATGDFSGYGRKADGSVWSWGGNLDGQLGDGTRTSRANPIRVIGVPRAIAIASGAYHGLALGDDGRVWAWGDNQFGQLGDGTTTDRLAAIVVPGLPAIVAVAAGRDFSAALASDGGVWVWGDNDYGQLGDGSTTGRTSAARVAGIPAMARVATATGSLYATQADGTMWSWGSNLFGELGYGAGSIRAPVPKRAVDGVARLSSGIGTQVLAVRSDGFLWTWGSNIAGALGNGAPISQTVPRRVSIGRVASVSTGIGHTVAALADGTVWSWGDNNVLQLGDATAGRGPRSTPAPVPGLSDVTTVAAGGEHNLALRSDGSVWAWGDNLRGALGDGTLTGRSRPVRVVGLPAIRDIAAGLGSSMALDTGGGVWTWGSNFAGQLGDGSGVEFRTLPARVTGLPAIQSITANYERALALDVNGLVWQWGLKGPSPGTLVSRPVLVAGLSGVVGIATGFASSLALRDDGTVWSFGDNSFGQLGDGTFVFREAPARVAGLTDVVRVRGGREIAFAIRRDGSVLSWGGNFEGEIGDGTFVLRSRPVVVLRQDGAGNVATNNWYLDLEPAIPGLVPPEFLPAFGTVSRGIPSASLVRVTADVTVPVSDQNASGSVYVFALAPVDIVRTSKSGEAPLVVGEARWRDGRKDTPIACVLAQLNAEGQLQAVSTSGLQALLTGALAGLSTGVPIVNGVPASGISGATFFVGYGNTGSSMINSGTNRGVASIPGTRECRPQAPQTGWWWNPAESGRGFAIEVQGRHLFYAAFLYDETGRATWTIASGNTSLDGSLFAGDLLAFNGGQTLAGPYKAPAPARTIGQLLLTFNNAQSGTMLWPGGAVQVERFNFNGLSAPPQANVPESGWWWNANESGRGYFIEWQNGFADLAGFMYDDAGNPVWYLVLNPTPDARTLTGSWTRYANGQTITGAYKPATLVDPNVAPITIRFDSTTTGLMTLPGGNQVPITRFRF